ncbi:hypothetical protein Q3G72_013018 [Acer saccharum]|nr:hypothetical protein Q3G72_013018 [Acer saccharum]
MNPLTLVKRIQNINSKEAALGTSEEASWHDKYKDSAYVYVSGIPFDLTEGDLLAVFAHLFPDSTVVDGVSKPSITKTVSAPEEVPKTRSLSLYAAFIISDRFKFWCPSVICCSYMGSPSQCHISSSVSMKIFIICSSVTNFFPWF